MRYEPLYVCHHCRDIGYVLRLRERSDGMPLGWFGSPCDHCKGGQVAAREWSENGLKRAGQENERGIERLESLLQTDDPSAEAQRWRSAAKSRQDHRAQASAVEFKPISGAVKAPDEASE